MSYTSNIRSLLEDQKLKKCDLENNETLLNEIIKEYENKIDLLSKLSESEILEKLKEIYPKDMYEGEEFNRHKKNLSYLKSSHYLGQQPKNIDMDIDTDIFKELRLEELINIKTIQNKDEEFKLDIRKLKEIVDERKKEKEKWDEYNIVTTMSQLLQIPEENITLISCLQEYIEFTSNLENSINYVSRGQKDCTYKLKPSLYRKHDSDYRFHADNYESAFKQKIVYYDKEIKNKSEQELRAEGQHFGLPTNYLDFTEAHLISLLFAIEEYEYTDQHSIIYFIDSYSYNKAAINISQKLIDYSDENCVNTTTKYESRSFFIKLGNSNERIHFQKGCFLKVAYDERDELERKLKDYCKVVIIKKDCKKKILKDLFNLGITFENIYPDKDNVVKSIKFRYEEMIGGDY